MWSMQATQWFSSQHQLRRTCCLLKGINHEGQINFHLIPLCWFFTYSWLFANSYWRKDKLDKCKPLIRVPGLTERALGWVPAASEHLCVLFLTSIAFQECLRFIQYGYCIRPKQRMYQRRRYLLSSLSMSLSPSYPPSSKAVKKKCNHTAEACGI